MGASSSSLLDEAKITKIKELVDSVFQSFSVFYRQQYSAAHFGHLHQELEPHKKEKGLLLTPGPRQAPEEVLYQGCVKFSCWDEQGKKSRERYAVLRRDCRVEIHENMEAFSRGCAARSVLQTAGGSVFTTEEEFRAHLEQTCVAVLNEVKEDCSSVASPPDPFAVYLHLPYMGHACFVFQQDAQRDHFLSALKTCIRHGNLDPWCDSSYQSQAYIRALRLYRQDKGCYESWEMLLGTEEKVLASQVMEEVLPWLQSQLQSRVKGKKSERIRQWLAVVQATYTLVVEQLTASLEALREECHHTASDNQALIRSDLDQIISSHCFVEEKVRVCICEDAEKVCSESVAPYMSSILEVLTQNISAGILGMRHTLHTQIDSAFTHTNGETGETKKVLSTLRSISLDQCYRQVENLTVKLEGLKERFGLSSSQRLVHSAHLEMEKLLDSAVYTLALFLQSSAGLQPSQIHVKMDGAKERVLKQLDYDSGVVQRRLYQEALLEITLPALIRGMDSRWKTELQHFEQYIFSDYSSFILVHNVYEDVLRDVLSKKIETVVQDAATKRNNSLSLDPPDLEISQYNLLGQTPPHTAPGSPATHVRDSPSAAPGEEAAPEVEASDPQLNADAESNPDTAQDPEVTVTAHDELCCLEERGEVTQLGTNAPSTPIESSNVDGGSDATHDGAPDHPESTRPIRHSPDLSLFAQSSPPCADAPAECAPSDPSATPETSAPSDPTTSDPETEDTASVQHPRPSPSRTPCIDSPMKISLGSLSEAIGCNSTAPVMQAAAQRSTDRAVYLTGEMKYHWELEREKGGKEKGGRERIEEETANGEEQKTGTEGAGSESPAESATVFTGQRERDERADDEGSGLEADERKDDEDTEERGPAEKDGEIEEEEGLCDLQPMESQAESNAEVVPVDSVAIIRDLTTEITEVETACPNSSHTP